MNFGICNGGSDCSEDNTFRQFPGDFAHFYRFGLQKLRKKLMNTIWNIAYTSFSKNASFCLASNNFRRGLENGTSSLLSTVISIFHKAKKDDHHKLQSQMLNFKKTSLFHRSIYHILKFDLGLAGFGKEDQNRKC